jgi:hypothetical protein
MNNSLMKHILTWLILLISIAYFTCLSNAESNKFTVKLLENELLQGAEDTLDDYMDIFSKVHIFQAVIELDTACIPTLTKALSSASRIRKIIGGIGLGIIGTKEALENLELIAVKSNDISIQYVYFMTISRRGTSSDLSFLMQTVKDNKNEKLSYYAAYALAIYHPEILKNKNMEAFKYPNDLIELNPVRGLKTKFEADSPDNELIAELISHGIPRMNERNLFIDTENNLTWKLKGDTWYCTKGVDALIKNEEISMNYKTAHISFSTYISADKSRALVDVGLVFGGKNGSGFVYSLRKTNGKWQINYMSETWVS